MGIMTYTINALLRIKKEGVKEGVAATQQMEDNMKGTAAAAERAEKILARSKSVMQSYVAPGGGGGGGGAGARTTYQGQRGITGSRQAGGRNFAGMASLALSDDGGGRTNAIVGAYAELAANLFAVSAGFSALSEAARVEQLTRGLEILGSRAGTSLTLTAKGLREVTDNAISMADAMRATAQAASAGLGADEIERLGKVARGASIGLGRGMAESMDRLTRGAIKLEPELLDELGIMVRLDEAVKQYALENDKVASSLTLTERRQAFLNAVLEEGERKFGDIADAAGTNPYDKLLSKARDLGTEILKNVNVIGGPIANLISNFPVAVLVLFRNTIQKIASKVLPTVSSAITSLTNLQDKYNLRLQSSTTLFKNYGEQLESVKAQMSNLRLGAIAEDNFLVTDALAIADDDTISKKQQIVMLENSIKGEKLAQVGLEGQALAASQARVAQASTLLTLKREELVAVAAMEKIEKGRLAVDQARTILGISQTTAMGVFGDLLEEGKPLKGLGEGLKTAFGGATASIQNLGKNAGGTFKSIKMLIFGVGAYGTATVTVLKMLSATLISFLPFIFMAVLAFQALIAVVKAFESEAVKRVKKIKEELKELVTSSEEVGRQIEISLTKRDFTSGFEAAVKNINELISKIKELEMASADAAKESSGTIRGFTETQFKERGRQAALGRSYEEIRSRGFVDIGREAYGQEGLTALMASSTEEAQALEQIFSRLEAVTLPATFDQLVEGFNNAKEAGYSTSQALEDVLGRTIALEGAWKSVGEAAKKAGQGIKKFYGKDFAETTYSDVSNGLVEIQRQFENLTEAGLKTEGLAAAFDRLRDGGIELAAELNALTGTADFTKNFNEASDIQAKINALRAAGAIENEAEISRLEARYNELAQSTVQAFIDADTATRSVIKNTAQKVLESQIEIAKEKVRILDLDKSILETNQKIVDLERKARNLRAFGAEKFASPLAQLDQELAAAKQKRDIENDIIDRKEDLLTLEFRLLDLQNRQARDALLQSEVAMDQLETGLLVPVRGGSYGAFQAEKLTGEQIVDRVIRSKEAINSLEDFKNVVSLSDKATEDQIAGLYALFTALQSANSAIDLSSQAYERQEEASRRSRDQRDAEVDAIQASIDAYNAQDAARLRELDRLDKEAKALNDVTDSLNRLADARLLAAELARDLEITRIGASLTEDESIEREIARQEEVIKRRRDENNRYLSDNFREQERLLIAARNLRTQLEQLQADPEASAESIADTRTRLEEANTAANNFIMQFGLGIIANEQELQNLIASLGILNTELDNLSLENVLGRARADAQNMAGFRMSNMGLGSSLLGTQDTIIGLAEEVASTDQRYGKNVANVLADPEAMRQIYQTANAIEFATMAAEEFSKTGEVIRNSVTDAFVSIIDGSKKAKDAFADMAKAILKQIIQMIVKMLVFKAIEAGLNVVTGGTGGTALMALINPSAAGGIMAYANGGIISARDGTEGIIKRPTYLVGEGRYNEAVVPLPNGRAIPVQMHGGGTSQQNNVSVNVNVSNEGQVSTETQGSDMTNLGAVIATAVQKELIAQKMPGGILNRYGVA